MRKFVMFSALAAAIAAASLPVHAQFVPGSPQTATFDVNINLTTGCKITTAPVAVAFTYTAFQTTAAALDTNGTFKVACTKNLNYTLALDNAGSYTDQATDLAYTLSLSSASSTGTGADQTFAITGNMPATQSGTCATTGASCTNSASTNKTRTLTVAY